MKNRYFWPYYTGIVVLLIWLVISCILGSLANYAGENINHIPFYIFPLLIFAPGGIFLIPMILTFVIATEDDFICFKYGLLRCKMKFSDITEWGLYIKSGGRGPIAVFYMTSIPTSELQKFKVINKKILKHKNKRKFITLGIDDTRIIDFMNEKFPMNKGFLYEKPEYFNSIDENSSIIN